jgi:leucyl-tRNA synthetase
LDRIWNLGEKIASDNNNGCSKVNEASLHRTIKKVGDDIDSMKFNTAIAAMMSLVNEFYDKGTSRGDMKTLLVLLSPFAPHITEELWEMLGFDGGLCCEQPWPVYDEAKTVESQKTIAVQVNGKLRSTVTVPTDADDETVIAAASEEEKVKNFMAGMELVKAIVVKNKLVNLILKPKKLDN